MCLTTRSSPGPARSTISHCCKFLKIDRSLPQNQRRRNSIPPSLLKHFIRASASTPTLYARPIRGKLSSTLPRPPKPRKEIDGKALAKLHPKAVRSVATTETPTPDIANLEQHTALLNIASSTNGT